MYVQGFDIPLMPMTVYARRGENLLAPTKPQGDFTVWPAWGKSASYSTKT